MYFVFLSKGAPPPNVAGPGVTKPFLYLSPLYGGLSTRLNETH